MHRIFYCLSLYSYFWWRIDTYKFFHLWKIKKRFWQLLSHQLFPWIHLNVSDEKFCHSLWTHCYYWHCYCYCFLSIDVNSSFKIQMSIVVNQTPIEPIIFIGFMRNERGSFVLFCSSFFLLLCYWWLDMCSIHDSWWDHHQNVQIIEFVLVYYYFCRSMKSRRRRSGGENRINRAVTNCFKFKLNSMANAIITHSFYAQSITHSLLYKQWNGTFHLISWNVNLFAFLFCSLFLSALLLQIYRFETWKLKILISVWYYLLLLLTAVVAAVMWRTKIDEPIHWVQIIS